MRRTALLFLLLASCSTPASRETLLRDVRDAADAVEEIAAARGSSDVVAYARLVRDVVDQMRADPGGDFSATLRVLLAEDLAGPLMAAGLSREDAVGAQLAVRIALRRLLP